MKEIYKNINEIYQVSNLGNIKSIERTTNNNGGLMLRKEKLLKPSIDNCGYKCVGLYIDNKNKVTRIHSLVAMMFLNYKPDGTSKLVCDHIDNNKLNNRLDNLQLITNRNNSTKDKKGYTSEYIGVSWSEGRNKWVAQIRINNKQTYLGRFNNELEAAEAYQTALKTI